MMGSTTPSIGQIAPGTRWAIRVTSRRQRISPTSAFRAGCCARCWRGASETRGRNGTIVSAVSSVVWRRSRLIAGDTPTIRMGGFGTAFSYPRSGWRNTDEPLGEDEGGEGSVVAYHGHQLYGLTWWYEVSGDERAVTLARKLARFVMQPRFWGAEPEPLMVAGHEQGHFITHLHARCVALRGLLRYAVATNDQRAKEFVRFAYEFARTLGIPRPWMVRLLRRQQPLRLLRRLRLGRHGSLGHQTQRRRPGRLLG